MYSKIDANDRFCIDQFEHIKEHSNKDRTSFTTAITEMRDELKLDMSKDSETLKSYVLGVTNNATAHRETLQDRYDEKMDKIKDVCANYFAKYEKHLMQQQELIKALEERQEGWINTLIKPQEVNQARLFSIDSRIKEGETQRIEDQSFLKDTIKKLIFAIEQHS